MQYKMSLCQHYSDDVKRRLIELLEMEIDKEKIVKIIGYSQSTISYLEKNYDETGSVSNRKRCGRPRAITQRNEQRLRIIVKNKISPYIKQMSSDYKTFAVTLLETD
jgi:transposase